MLRSLRVTLTLWYVGVLAIVLACFSVALYVLVASNFRRDIDERLVLQADATAESVFAFWRAERTAPGAGAGNWQGAPTGTFLGDLTRGELPSLLSRWAERTGSLEADRFVRFLSADGEPLGASSRFDQLQAPVSADARRQLRARHTHYRTFPLPDRRLRIVTRPVSVHGQLLYGVQLASDLREADESLARLRLWLFILVPLTLLTVAVLSLMLATTALSPIRPLITKTQRFITEHLHESLATPQSHPDELQRLALAINDLLDRLERNLRRLRQFTAAASHELRTPLTIMKGEIGLALRKPRAPEEYQRVLHAHLQAVNELAHTVEELLELAQSEATAGETEWQAVELGALARRQGEALRPIAKERGVALELPANGAAWARGDPRLLERLVANLMDNAIKHIPPKGRVTIRASRQGEEACLTIADTGPGISTEEWPKLFDRFFTPKSSDDTSNPGAGLGLSLCRWIVEAHHGRLELDRAPEAGSAITVRLPAIPPPA